MRSKTPPPTRHKKKELVASAALEQKEEAADGLTLDGLFAKNTHTDQAWFPWFSLRDVLYRYSLTLVGFYWALLTTPISFFVYTVHYWFDSLANFVLCRWLRFP